MAALEPSWRKRLSRQETDDRKRKEKIRPSHKARYSFLFPSVGRIKRKTAASKDNETSFSTLGSWWSRLILSSSFPCGLDHRLPVRKRDVSCPDTAWQRIYGRPIVFVSLPPAMSHAVSRDKVTTSLLERLTRRNWKRQRKAPAYDVVNLSLLIARLSFSSYRAHLNETV